MPVKLVCNVCFEEEGIKQFITLNGLNDWCSFCNKQSLCVPMECVIDHIMVCLQPYYTDEPEGVYDMEEGVFWEALDPIDILQETVFARCEDIPDNICSSLVKGFGDGIWTVRNPYGEDYWWERFSEFVKFERRYFFLESAVTEDEPGLRGDPKEMLSATLDDCRSFTIKKENLKLFRCRYESNSEQLNTLEDFLSPPPEQAIISNRMNPPGIPHLYAAMDSKTAFAETKRENGTYKIAELELEDPINLVDLSELPPIPSMFDPDSLERNKLTKLTFIHRFEQEINKPTPGDDRINIDYVPSQVFCEYMKVNAPDIQGIIYSSKKSPSGKNICLFIKKEKLREVTRILHIETKSYN